MEQFTADKKLETFEDFDRVYDECLNYLREENIHIDQELKDIDRKVPYHESVKKKNKPKHYLPGTNPIIEEETSLFDDINQDNESVNDKDQLQCFLSKENNINDKEAVSLDNNDPYYEVIEEKPKPKAYLQSENNNIGQDNISDERDPNYETIENNYKSISHFQDGSIQNEDKSKLCDGKGDVNANTQDKIKSNTNLHKENILNNKETKVFNEKEPLLNGIEEKILYQVENELKSNDSIDSVLSESRTDRLRKLSQQLPKIIITQSNSSLNVRRHDDVKFSKLNRNDFVNDDKKFNERRESRTSKGKVESTGKKNGKYFNINYQPRPKPYGEHPKRLVCKGGVENVALISNVPFERIRLLNDTFHTLINLRWRWIVTGTIVVHFAIWLVFAVFWYIAAYAHYDFEPNPPPKSCVTGGHNFLTIFLASVESQTTIGFGDRAIDEECPEAIFLLIMQLILGTGLSGVLTCVVYAKLTRPEKLSKDGVGFSKKAVVSVRDGRLCLMMRAWDLNYDHIISSEFTAHFINTHKTKEGEIIRYYAQSLSLQQRQFLLWPVTLVHVIDSTSPLYKLGPDDISNDSYEITLSLKGASASMGTFTQSQTSYLPSEILWGYKFPPVVKYHMRKRKYVVEQNKLDVIEAVDTPFRSAQQIASGSKPRSPHSPHPLHTPTPDTPGCFSEQISSFHQERSSSFRRKGHK